MSSSEQEKREQEARRARRLAERAEQRAKRKAEQARLAAERAEKLAEEVSGRPRRSRRDKDDRFEDKFDRMAERWEQKAETWFEATFNFGDDEDLYGDAMDDGLDDGSMGDRDSETSRSNRRRAREAREARADERRRKRVRRERRKRRYSNRTFSSRFRTGRGLYRDKERGKICGVCAGTADYLDVETWQVRLVAVLGLVFVPSFAVPAYFIAYFLMDDKPYYRKVTDKYPEAEDMETDDMGEDANDFYEPRQPELSNTEAFRQAKQKFADLEDRLRSMETHVTSSRFELQRELKKISGDEG